MSQFPAEYSSRAQSIKTNPRETTVLRNSSSFLTACFSVSKDFQLLPHQFYPYDCLSWNIFICFSHVIVCSRRFSLALTPVLLTRFPLSKDFRLLPHPLQPCDCSKRFSTAPTAVTPVKLSIPKYFHSCTQCHSVMNCALVRNLLITGTSQKKSYWNGGNSDGRDRNSWDKGMWHEVPIKGRDIEEDEKEEHTGGNCSEMSRVSVIFSMMS